MESPLLWPGEVAAMFGVARETASRWGRDGRLASVRTPGGCRRFFRAEAEAVLAGQPLTPAQVRELREQAAAAVMPW